MVEYHDSRWVPTNNDAKMKAAAMANLNRGEIFKAVGAVTRPELGRRGFIKLL